MAGLESRDAATGELLGEVPRTSVAELRDAVGRAREAQAFWAALPLADRARYLRRVTTVVVREIDELTELLAREQGRPRTEALLMELLPSVDALRWAAREGPRVLGSRALRTRQAPLRGKRSVLTAEPMGVVGIASPWASPWASALRRVALALVAGNGVVLHAATLTPLIGGRVGTVLEQAGVPEGLVAVVAGEEAGAALDDVGLARVVRLAGGGRDPLLVRADAAVGHAAGGGAWAAFANAGQARANVGRAYVAREVAERFVEAVVERARRLRIGDPRDWNTEVGPLTGPAHRDRVQELVGEAVEGGARLRCGGPVDVPGLPGAFYAPAVLTDVSPGARVLGEEVPGPVLPVLAVDSDEEAIRLASEGGASVGASVWTADGATGARIAGELRAERTWLNDHMLNALSPAGFGDFAHQRLRVGDSGRLRDLWWHPYDASLAETARAAARYLYGREDERYAALLEGARPALRLARRLAHEARRR